MSRALTMPTTLGLIHAIGTLSGNYTMLGREDRAEFPDAPHPAMINRADPVVERTLVQAIEIATGQKVDTSVLISVILGCGQMEVIAYSTDHELIALNLTIGPVA